MNKKFHFFILGVLSLMSFQIYAQKYVVLGNLIPYNTDFETNICLVSNSIPSLDKEYAKLDKEKFGLYVVDSFSFENLCNYITEKGKLLSYERDGSRDPIYQIVINTNGSFQLYFEFYTKNEVLSFYEPLILYLKNKDKNIEIIPILEKERKKYK